MARDICGRPIPPEATTQEVFALLEGAGWTFVRRSGNNYAIFRSEKSELLNVPMVQGRRIKRAYLRIVCDKLDLADRLDPHDME